MLFNASAITTLGAGKVNDGVSLLLYKRKDGGCSMDLPFTIYECRHEMGLGAFRNSSLKKPMNVHTNGVLFYMRDVLPLKNAINIKCEAMRNLHYLRNIALEIFESSTIELKNDGKDGNWFVSLELHLLSRLGCMPVL